MVASLTPPTEDPAHNPGMCPDWELNQQPFDLLVAFNPLSNTSQGNREVLTESIITTNKNQNSLNREYGKSGKQDTRSKTA